MEKMTAEILKRYRLRTKAHEVGHCRMNPDDCLIVSSWKRKEYEGSFDIQYQREDLPTAFVYESDNLALPLQLALSKKIIEEHAEHILSVCYSGSKSIHYLFPLSEKDSFFLQWDKETGSSRFKTAYKIAFNKIFKKHGISFDDIDDACGSIGHGARMPAAYRKDTGRIQTTLFLNPRATPLNMDDIRQTILTEETRARAAKKNAPQRLNTQGTDDEMKKMQRIATKNSNIRQVYDALCSGVFPSGLNYFSLLLSMKGCGFSDGIRRQFYEKARAAHPTNLTKDFEYYVK